MKLNLNFWTFLLAVEFEQNKYQFDLAEDVIASVVIKSTLNVQYQTEPWYSGNICFSEIC